MYVEAPKEDLAALTVLSVVDVFVMLMVVFGTCSWSFSEVWDIHATHYTFKTGGLELVVLGLVRCVVSALCASQSRAGLVTIDSSGRVHGSGVAAAATLLSALSTAYAIVKLAVCARGAATAWAPALATLLLAGTEAVVLLRVRRAVRTIASDTLKDRLLGGDGEDDVEGGGNDDDEESRKAQLSPRQLVTVLKPYFWPKGDDERAVLNRLRSTATWVFVIGSKACSVTSPFFLSDATNALYNGDYTGAARGVALYALLSFTAKFLKECQSLIYLKVKQQAYIEIAEHTFAHLHTLSLQWHLKKKMGNVIRSMDRGTEAANNLVTYLFLYLVPAIGECVATVIIFYFKFSDWRLATMAFAALTLYGYLTVKITLWRKKLRAVTNKYDNEFHDKATDSMINYETVKYFSNEDFEVARFTESVRNYQLHSTSTQASLSLLNVLQQLIMHLTLLAGLVLAAKSVIDGRYTVGDFVSVNTYMVNLFTPLNFLGTVYNIIIQAFVDIRNLSELLAQNPDIVDAPGAQPLPLPPKEQGVGVEFRGVYFWYPTQPNHRGLRGISFYVPPGTTTALVGHTGAGKTTISRLLFRFYDPMKGAVLLNGYDIKQVQQKTVRKAIGVVPQDTVMFNDTILHNLKYGKLDATMEEVEAAAEAAQIRTFIESLPERWETNVGERGLKLSGGEKQRVAIARCLLKNPPVVLLDEATSALDTRTEHGVQLALQRLKRNRTTLVIAHRLSTIRGADQILVLGEGQVLERGAHAQLLAAGGEYAHMWNMQLHEDRQRQLSERSLKAGELEGDEGGDAPLTGDTVAAAANGGYGGSGGGGVDDIPLDAVVGGRAPDVSLEALASADAAAAGKGGAVTDVEVAGFVEELIDTDDTTSPAAAAAEADEGSEETKEGSSDGDGIAAAVAAADAAAAAAAPAQDGAAAARRRGGRKKRPQQQG